MNLADADEENEDEGDAVDATVWFADEVASSHPTPEGEGKTSEVLGSSPTSHGGGKITPAKVGFCRMRCVYTT